MQLAKPHIDIGLYTDHTDTLLAFWRTTIGLAFEEMVPLGQGVRQLRHAMNGSVLKLNSSRDPLQDAAPSGYRELLVARADCTAPQRHVDADGNVVTLVPTGHRGITGIGLQLCVREPAAFHDFYGRVLGLPAHGADGYRCGDSLLFIAGNGDPNAAVDTPMRARGYRYFTIQVRDVDREHADVLSRGAKEALPPVTLGKIARISLLRDPDGNWIELSQRASLTGEV